MHSNSRTPNHMDYGSAQKQLELSSPEKIARERQKYKRSVLLETNRTPACLTALTPQPRRNLFHRGLPRTPVRSTKNEGHVQTAGVPGGAVSVYTQAFTDSTLCDRLWSKLDPPDKKSMSSSPSLSSSDTVIDLSRQILPWLGHPHAHLLPCSPAPVSKSNLNIQQILECCLLQSFSEDSLSRLCQQCHTWSRLCIEGLLQSGGPATASMSKSLGDLIPDNISPRFDIKYCSISKSLIVQDALRQGYPTPPAGTLTLHRSTNVQPLTPVDLASPVVCVPQEDSVDERLVRRTSSRCQSRVRYIAKRAKNAQERKQLQGLCWGIVGTHIVEHRNPEGASLDLLSQLALSPMGPQSSTDPDSGGCHALNPSMSPL